MNNKFAERKRIILRRIYGALSLSTALFVFQACYGTPHDMVRDVLIHGSVKSKANNQAIPGIKVTLDGDYSFALTDNSGQFEMYAIHASEYKLLFQDVDSIANGNFKEKDTVLNISNASYFLNISLDAK